MQDAAHERPDACDRAANHRAPAAGELARIREPFGERHRDSGTERGGDAGDECVVRFMGDDGDGEDRRERRERAVDETYHRRLHSLQKEGLTVGH